MKKTIPACKKCHVRMVLGIALVNGTKGSPDFPGDTGKEDGCTQSADSLKVKLVHCWKCPKCGHSISDLPTIEKAVAARLKEKLAQTEKFDILRP